VDDGPELTQRERAVLIGLEQSLARGELVPERGLPVPARWRSARWARWCALIAALGAIVVGVIGLVHVEPGARELLVAGLVLSIVAAGALLVLVVTPMSDEVLVRRRLRRLQGRART
jgi:hypothetical protein